MKWLDKPPPKDSQRIAINFIHSDGNRYTWSFRADALYAMLREGDLPEDMQQIIYVDFPPPSNARWMAMDRPREEMREMLQSLVKPFTSF